MIKSYRELRRLQTFEERFEYLKMGGVVGRSTFGFDRYVNQTFYKSREWAHTRNGIIVRDNGCDLGIKDREIHGKILIHHINPITIEDIEYSRDCIFDPDNLITTNFNTHNAIHYGDSSLLIKLPQERKKGDTHLWKAYSRL
jgi:hypothetical protein